MSTFKKAQLSDIDIVSKIIEEARIKMKNDGLIQWQNGYPNRSTLLKDIKSNQLYKYEIDGFIAGVCCINSDFYDSYPNHAPQNTCQTIHRFAINNNFLGHGIGNKMLKAAEDEILKLGFTYAIIDTYTMNKKMIGLIQKRKFENLGEFSLIEGCPNWVLYQKKLK